MNAPNFKGLNRRLQLRMFAAAVSGRYPVISAMGGWGSGKSYGLVYCIKALAVTYPGSRWALVTDTRGRMLRVLQPLCELLMGQAGWRWHGDPSKSYWESPQGSRVYLVPYFRPSTRSSTANPLEGMDLNGAGVDECQVWSNPEVLQKLIGRARRQYEGLRNVIILTGLPVADAWWLKAAEEAGGITFTATSFANQENLSPEFFENARLTLDPDDYDAMVMGKPQRPKGVIYRDWVAESWPHGNLLDDWSPVTGEHVTIGVDFGLNLSVLLFAHDEARNLDIIFDELSLSEAYIEDWVPRLLRKVWPKADPWHKPEDVPFWLTQGAGDKAGLGRDSHGTDDISWLRQRPPKGLGVHLRTTTDPVKVDIANGIKRVRRLILDHNTEHRQLVCTRELWERGLSAPEKQRTFARSLLRYRWREDGSGRAEKDGYSDHAMDALRYWVMAYRWFDGPLDDRVVKQSVTQPKKKTLKPKTRPRSGQGRPRGF
jgi:hypothetical protein